MSEKRGHTEKLKYDFNSARCCEIQLGGKWHRVTAREFRSFHGPRRILNVDNPTSVFYQEYNGPVYLFGTNKIVRDSEKTDGVNFENGEDPRTFGMRRKHENITV